jgi:hypothetical protein
MASTYDEALAEALGDADAELAERLRGGDADGNDRKAAREQLDEGSLRRFELAHPVAPSETAVEIDLGELDIDEVKKAVKAAADENEGREIVVRLAVRVEPSDD